MATQFQERESIFFCSVFNNHLYSFFLTYNITKKTKTHADTIV